MSARDRGTKIGALIGLGIALLDMTGWRDVSLKWETEGQIMQSLGYIFGAMLGGSVLGMLIGAGIDVARGTRDPAIDGREREPLWPRIWGGLIAVFFWVLLIALGLVALVFIFNQDDPWKIIAWIAFGLLIMHHVNNWEEERRLDRFKLERMADQIDELRADVQAMRRQMSQWR